MTASEGPNVNDAAGARPFYKSPFFIAFLVGAAMITLYRPLAMQFRSSPPPLYTIDAWSLVDQNDAPFGTDDLKGHVYIASYFFTRCPSICKELTKTMVRVQKAMQRHGDAVQLVSFTVDPENDTPEVLRAYGEKYGADFSRWHFLTGEMEQVKDVVATKMKLHVGEKEPTQDELYEISHMGKIVLFDQNGDMRALFTTDTDGLGALGNATALLVEQGPGHY